jgi:hypothetical protein
MLAQKTYPTEHIDRCRQAVDERLAAYRAAVADTSPQSRAQFEQLYCCDLVVLLDAWFMHRTRAVEGKDGNPANEVRMLATGIIHHNGVLAADSTSVTEPPTRSPDSRSTTRSTSTSIRPRNSRLRTATPSPDASGRAGPDSVRLFRLAAWDC